jgi:hypothetical protein
LLAGLALWGNGPWALDRWVRGKLGFEAGMPLCDRKD